jgi:hypothetical protein
VNGKPSAWRIMSSDDPVFTVAVSIWVDGKPARPGLAMRARMAMNSLFGSRFAPVVVTVTPVVDWATLKGGDRLNVEASLPAFLLQHAHLDRTVGALSAR